ncbi:MAG: hypothetical protein ABIP90_06300 [Vicinamibacterales bacterium]
MTTQRPAREQSQALQQQLDTLAARAHRFLAQWSFTRDLRLTMREALVWMLAAPVVLFGVQVVALLTRRGPLPLPLWAWFLLALAGPIAFVVARMAALSRHRTHDRRACLGAYDLQLDSRDRLVTADEFIAGLGAAYVGRRFSGAISAAGNDGAAEATPYASGDHFRQAAIEDAADHIARANQTTLVPKPLPEWSISRRSWLSAAAAVALIAIAVWLGNVALGIRTAPDPESAMANAELQTLPARVAASLLDLKLNPTQPDRPAPNEPAQAGSPQTSADPSTKTPKNDQDADGQSHAGGQANSRSSSQAMSSSGTASNQQTPSKPLAEDPPQDQQAAAAGKTKKADGKKAEQQASSATSGQGQSKSSSSDSNSIPSTDQPDRAGANKDDGKDEEGAQDEVEEEKTAGVERPGLRRNKPPVDRNLSSRPAGDQPNPNANGRSGPGGRKKTRGVPAMILGIPTPDRIQGMTNPGRSKVTQENSTPKEEPQAALNAEQRAPRELPFGHVEHPLLKPWMLNLVEKYFLQLRSEQAARGGGAPQAREPAGVQGPPTIQKKKDIR